MVLKPLTAAELAVLAAGPPAQRPDDFVGWRKERDGKELEDNSGEDRPGRGYLSFSNTHTNHTHLLL